MPTVEPKLEHSRRALTHHHSPVPVTPSAEARQVVKIARGFVGRDFARGQKERCAAFVRHVLQEAGVRVGVASHPTDFQVLPASLRSTNENLADSFAGNDVAKLIAIDERRPGDLILYRNTYGDFPRGTITHIGIYVGGDSIVHRPTAARPVLFERYNYAAIAEVRRPNAYADNPGHARHAIKLFMHDGHFRAFRNGCEVKYLRVEINLHHEVSVRIDGAHIDPALIELQIFA